MIGVLSGENCGSLHEALGVFELANARPVGSVSNLPVNYVYVSIAG